MGRQVQGQVRQRLGCLSRARVRAPEAARLDSGRHQTHTARGIDAVVGQHSGGAAPVPAPADGNFRRLRRTCRRAGRPVGGRTGASRHSRQHHRDLYFRRQRRQRRRPERHDQRIAGAERNPEHGRAAARRAGQDRRARCAGWPEDRQHVSRRLGLGRQYAVPAHQAGRLAFRRHPQSDGDLLAEGHQARQDAPVAVPPRQRHRRRPSTRSSASSRRRSSTASRRIRSTGSASPIRSAIRRRRRARSCSTSTTTAAAPSTRTAGSRPRSVRWCRGCPARPALPNGIRRKTNGNSIRSARISRRPTTLPRRSRSVWPSLQKTFDEQAKANKVYPLGAGIWLRLHPEDRIKTPYTSWRFDATTTRMPEFTAPGVGRESNTVTIDAEFGENASGVLYALGGSGGGLTAYMDKGQLVYEYNMMIIERYIARSKSTLGAGKHRIEVTTKLESAQPLSPARGHSEGRWTGSRQHHRQADRARRLLRQRNLRRRRRSRIDGVARLLRPASVPLRRQYRKGGSQTSVNSFL